MFFWMIILLIACEPVCASVSRSFGRKNWLGNRSFKDLAINKKTGAVVATGILATLAYANRKKLKKLLRFSPSEKLVVPTKLHSPKQDKNQEWGEHLRTKQNIAEAEAEMNNILGVEKLKDGLEAVKFVLEQSGYDKKDIPALLGFFGQEISSQVLTATIEPKVFARIPFWLYAFMYPHCNACFSLQQVQSFPEFSFCFLPLDFFNRQSEEVSEWISQHRLQYVASVYEADAPELTAVKGGTFDTKKRIFANFVGTEKDFIFQYPLLKKNVYNDLIKKADTFYETYKDEKTRMYLAQKLLEYVIQHPDLGLWSEMALGAFLRDTRILQTLFDSFQDKKPIDKLNFVLKLNAFHLAYFSKENFKYLHQEKLLNMLITSQLLCLSKEQIQWIRNILKDEVKESLFQKALPIKQKLMWKDIENEEVEKSRS